MEPRKKERDSPARSACNFNTEGGYKEKQRVTYLGLVSLDGRTLSLGRPHCLTLSAFLDWTNQPSNSKYPSNPSRHHLTRQAGGKEGRPWPWTPPTASWLIPSSSHPSQRRPSRSSPASPTTAAAPSPAGTRGDGDPRSSWWPWHEDRRQLRLLRHLRQPHHLPDGAPGPVQRLRRRRRQRLVGDGEPHAPARRIPRRRIPGTIQINHPRMLTLRPGVWHADSVLHGACAAPLALAAQQQPTTSAAAAGGLLLRLPLPHRPRPGRRQALRPRLRRRPVRRQPPRRARLPGLPLQLVVLLHGHRHLRRRLPSRIHPGLRGLGRRIRSPLRHRARRIHRLPAGHPNLPPLRPTQQAAPAAAQGRRLLPIWATSLAYGVVYAQIMTLFNKQGRTLDRRIGFGELPPAALQTLGPASILLFVPVYDRAIVPALRWATGNPSGLTMPQRAGAGMATSLAAVSVAALVEARRLATAREHGLVDQPGATVPMTWAWLVPQYAMMGVADVLAVVGLQELFYDQMPDGLRSLGLALYLSVMGIGGFISSLLISTIDAITSRGGGDSWFDDNLNRAHLDYFYWLLAGLSALELALYLCFARSYAYNHEPLTASYS